MIEMDSAAPGSGKLSCRIQFLLKVLGESQTLVLRYYYKQTQGNHMECWGLNQAKHTQGKHPPRSTITLVQTNS